MRALPLTAALVGTLATGTASGTPPPPPQPIAGFHTQRIECIVYDYLDDEVVNGELDCTGRARLGVSMMTRGRARTWVNFPPRAEPSYGSLLRVGKSWRFGRAFACTRAQTTVLTCTNRSAHGWVFDARAQVRLF